MYCLLVPMSEIARTFTRTLTNATLPYVLQIFNKGWQKAMRENRELKLGANIIKGKVTYKAVAEAFDLDYTSGLKFD